MTCSIAMPGSCKRAAERLCDRCPLNSINRIASDDARHLHAALTKLRAGRAGGIGHQLVAVERRAHRRLAGRADRDRSAIVLSVSAIVSSKLAPSTLPGVSAVAGGGASDWLSSITKPSGSCMKTMRDRPPISAGVPATVITRPPSRLQPRDRAVQFAHAHRSALVAPGSWNRGRHGLAIDVLVFDQLDGHRRSPDLQPRVARLRRPATLASFMITSSGGTQPPVH